MEDAGAGGAGGTGDDGGRRTQPAGRAQMEPRAEGEDEMMTLDQAVQEFRPRLAEAIQEDEVIHRALTDAWYAITRAWALEQNAANVPGHAIKVTGRGRDGRSVLKNAVPRSRARRFLQDGEEWRVFLATIETRGTAQIRRQERDLEDRMRRLDGPPRPPPSGDGE